MKQDQVPQDDEQLFEGRTREICYAVDENGNYVQVLSTGWAPKNAALRQTWDAINEEAQEILRQVQKETISPLAFFMTQGLFDIKLLSDYTGIPKRKIKTHMTPEVFRRLDQETLQTYADAFNISVDDLKSCRSTTASFGKADSTDK
ncbi:MAG: hypothetical protein LBV07_01735 [Syntrophobacterales bacterium]|jgi:hypothetical protein|nr:hypothetical protein [Syntrophobacterales bacterium]